MHHTFQSPNRLLLTALLLGVCADLLFFGRSIGISAALFVVLGLMALAWLSHVEERPPNRASVWLGAAASGFALLLALRETSLLSMLNACTTAGLLLMLAATFRGHPLGTLSWAQAMVHSLIVLVEAAFYPAPLLMHGARSVAEHSGHVRRLAPVGRGLLLAAPTLMIFTGLLAAADSVFAGYVSAVLTLHLPFDLPATLNHVLFTGLAGWLCAGGLLAALRNGPPGPVRTELPAEGDTQRLRPVVRRLLGFAEALTVLVSVACLFGAFMLVQAAYLFGGRDTLAQTGMTYSTYARRGFFELLAVACLALTMLLTLAALTRRDSRGQRYAFNIACATIVALVIGMLVSAFQRMLLYQAAYGYTHLRIYTLSFMIWLALVLLLFLVALFRAAPRLFSWGTFATALLYLAALNGVNPDALIARGNLARYHQSGTLDARYLATLSSDATPELVAALPALNGDAQTIIASALDAQRQRLERIETTSGWPAWHFGRMRALHALQAVEQRSFTCCSVTPP